MSASLWADMDAYLEAAVLADMGTAGLYATLPIAQIVIGPLGDIDQLTLPAVIIQSFDVEHEGGPHGDGAIHLDCRYPYTLAVLCANADFETSRANCQELGRRLRELLRTRYAFGGLAATDGETVQSTEIGTTSLDSFGEIAGEYVHGALLNLTVNTHI